MHDPSTLRKHADLMTKMADTLGLDLEEKALRGEVSIDEISDAVLRCSGCTNPEDCADWLARRADTAVDAAPGYCRNADLLATLKPD